MSRNRSSLKPIKGANRSLRRRLDLKGLALAAAPTAIVPKNHLVIFGLAVLITAILVGLYER